MIIPKKHIPRRAVLRGLGATVALPWLDAMVPALAPRALAATTPVRRFGAVFVPMGMNMARWTPTTGGALELSPILQPLTAFPDRLVVVVRLAQKTAKADDCAPQPRAQSGGLTT